MISLKTTKKLVCSLSFHSPTLTGERKVEEEEKKKFVGYPASKSKHWQSKQAGRPAKQASHTGRQPASLTSKAEKAARQATFQKKEKRKCCI